MQPIPRPSEAQVNRDLLGPLFNTGPMYYIAVGILAAIASVVIIGWYFQLTLGIGMTGKNRPSFWGLYITTFVFWIGISHAGTLISAILRVAQAEWRRPITRCAEAITTLALLTGSLFPIFHLGRAWLFYWMIPYPNSRYLWPNFQSPLMWDFIAINTYLTGSVTYLYLPMIPDMAVARDKATGWRKRMYRTLALGWRGTEREWVRLEKAISIMALLIIPVAVSVHTIVSWDFAMTLMPMWRSTIFGPYFVVGAIFSGIAALLIAMVVVRKYFNLQNYLQPIHFDNLAKMLLAMALLWFYFTFTEYLVTWYGNEAPEMAVFWSKISGRFAPLFWLMVACNFLIPFPILAIKKLRTIPLIFFASVCILNRDVAGAVPDHRADADASLPAVQLRHVPAVAHRGVHRGRHAWAVHTAVLSVREIQPDDFHLGNSGGPPGGGPYGRVASSSRYRRDSCRRCAPGSLTVAEFIDMPQTCLVRFAAPAEARMAIRRLMQAGITADSMEVMTSQPIHGAPFLPEQRPTKLRTWALAGATIGLLGGFGLASLSALNYPLVKGGMPIVSPWTVGLITYETTMLGAILATLVGLLVELRLPNFKSLPYDPSVVDGGVVLAVACPDNSRSSVESAVGAAGATKVRWV